MRSFTTEELEQATGFDRRTIAYYVQMGLIPRVGRRGPRTRYPKLVMDRLLCIRRVREAEEAGEIEPVSLGAMRSTFDRVAAELIARVADGQTPVATAFAVEDAPAQRAPGARPAAMQAAWSATEVREPSAPSAFDDRTAPEQLAVRAMIKEPAIASADLSAGEDWAEAADPAQETETELGDALSELQTRARSRQPKAGSLDRWSRVEISPDVAISVRGITDEDVPLLESVGKKLGQLISDRKDRSER